MHQVTDAHCTAIAFPMCPHLTSTCKRSRRSPSPLRRSGSSAAAGTVTYILAAAAAAAGLLHKATLGNRVEMDEI